MTMAQFSRDDILIYQGREEGLEEGIKAFILDKVEDGVAESIIVQKLCKHFLLDENTARQGAMRLRRKNVTLNEKLFY